MFGRNKVEDLPEIRVTPLDRLVADRTGPTAPVSSFEFVLREATIEKALVDDPSWPPNTTQEAFVMYAALKEQYEAGDLDGVVAELDLNAVVVDAERLATGSMRGIFPPRRNWPE